jgi:hypothetical protein
MTQTERRGVARIQLRKPAYINFEPYNTAGVITDISSAGLRFHTVAPLQQGGLVRLSILLGTARQIEAVGELVWTDSARTIGGVRFTVLPSGAAEEIRNWAEASVSDDPKSNEPLPASAPDAPDHGDQVPANSGAHAAPVSQNSPQQKIEAASARNTQPPAARVPAASVPGERPPWVPPSMRPAAAGASIPVAPNLPDPGAAHLQSWAVPPAYHQPPEMPWITHFEPDPPARGPFFRGLLGGIVICLMLAPIGWFTFRHYVSQADLAPLGTATPANQPLSPAASAPSPDVSDPLSSGGSLPSQEAQAVPSQQPSQEVSPAVVPNAQAPAEEKPRANSEAATPSQFAQSQLATPQTAPQETLSSRGSSVTAPAQPVAKAPALPPAQPADAGETQLMLARQYLDGTIHARDTSVASKLLWTAVEKGNATAETTLADLYLRGDGVAKNCDQARVLLAAASGKGNIEAMQKLQQLNQTGCR